MTEISQIIQKINNLPTLPAVLTELTALIKNEHSNVSDFEQVIKNDPALTANILQLANSAYFGFGGKIQSVGHAVSMLGSKRLLELASSVSLLAAIPDQLPCYQIAAKDFWRHSAAVAVLSEALTKELHISPPDLTFTAGILHDVGKIVVSLYCHDQEKKLSSEPSETRDMRTLEEEALGWDHNQIGEQLAHHWKLPGAVAYAIRWHHTPSQGPDESLQPLVDVIHMADSLAHMMGYGADVGGLRRTIDSGVVKRLAPSVQTFEKVMSEGLAYIQELGTLAVEEAS